MSCNQSDYVNDSNNTIVDWFMNCIIFIIVWFIICVIVVWIFVIVAALAQGEIRMAIMSFCIPSFIIFAIVAAGQKIDP